MIRTLFVNDRGQILVTILVFSVIIISITSAAVAMIINSGRQSSAINTSFLAEQVAESGAENALLRLVREPSYTGETLTVGNGTATITVTGTTTKTLTSVGVYGNFRKTVQLTVTFTNNVMTVTSWQEVY